MTLTTRNFIGFLLVLIIAFATAAPSNDVVDLTPTEEDVDLNPTGPETENESTSGFPNCKKKDGTDGICVPYTYCDEKTKIILTGGFIDTDARELGGSGGCEGPASINWCCSEEVEPPQINTTRVDACQPLDSDVCTWCVTLHKIKDSSIMNVEAFCAGSLIGSRIVLTAATCLTAAKQHTLFVQVPESPDKTRMYEALDQKLHPLYNSGTHTSDFGLIVLKEEVEWGIMSASGACLKPVKIGGNCMTFGLDIDDNFVSTFVQVSARACDNMGGAVSSEVYCGKSKENECFAVTGAPVLCDTGNNGLALVGVSRSGCIDGNIALGSYLGSNWIKMELDAMKVPPSVYMLEI